jgi:predicted glycoside hydrolase/deacetylase ChbG (UPF0249 family)
MKRDRAIVLCADDFGLSRGIDDGILALAARGRLTATGCMVAGPAFVADAGAVTALADRIDIGLHFALTDLAPLGPIPSLDAEGRAASLGRVLSRSLTGRIDYEEIAAEIGRQLDRFRAVIGRDPDFIDGHQHVHVLPGVRRALFSLYDRGVLDARRTWLRDCREAPAAIWARGVEAPKTLFIAMLAAGFGRAARARGITVNAGFGGITAFDPARFAATFPHFLERLGTRPLVMCHPADPAAAADPSDPIDRARRAEYAHLASDAFERDLAAAGVRLARMGEIAA